MKPNDLHLPFMRPPYKIHHSIPKLVLLSSITLLALNIFPLLNNHPLVQIYISSSSSLSTSSSSTTSIDHSSYYSPPPRTPPPPVISTYSIVSPPPSPTNTSFTTTTPPPPPPSPPPPLLISTNFIASSTPPPPPPPPPMSINTENSKSTRLAKGCDISKGEWVRDPEAPYYTNTTCWAIQEHQNCMKYGRPDTDFLKWRWKPKDCELPRFDPYRFLELVKGKSIAFVGDSLARNHMQSLMCLLSKVEYPVDIEDTVNYKSMHYTNYNLRVSIFWSPFLVKYLEVHKPGSYGPTIWNLYLDEVDKKWSSKLNQFDYLIISGGNWFNRPSIFHHRRQRTGCLYCDAYDIPHETMHYANRMAFRTALRAINNKRNNFKGRVILRALSPSHFENGEWNKGGDCVRTTPYRRGEARMEGRERELYKAQAEEFRKAERAGRRRGVEFRVLDTTEAMLLRPDGHPSRYGHLKDEKVVLYNDCVHWCLPGPVDTWNDFLLHTLSK